MKLLIAFLFSASVQAAIPEKQIIENIGKKLDAIASSEKWKDFLDKSPELFPKTTKASDKTSVVVKKEELDVDGSFFTLGVGYRQTFIHAPLAKVKKILKNSEGRLIVANKNWNHAGRGSKSVQPQLFKCSF